MESRHDRVIDRFVQLHGGYGFAWLARIYGGTNEVMKQIIARSACCA